jgi:hypothetical protein
LKTSRYPTHLITVSNAQEALFMPEHDWPPEIRMAACPEILLTNRVLLSLQGYAIVFQQLITTKR